jgi:hypothetical protein
LVSDLACGVTATQVTNLDRELQKQLVIQSKWRILKWPPQEQETGTPVESIRSANKKTARKRPMKLKGR